MNFDCHISQESLLRSLHFLITSHFCSNVNCTQKTRHICNLRLCCEYPQQNYICSHFSHRITQDEGQSDDSKCPLPQVVAAIRSHMVQPASQEVPQASEPHQEGEGRLSAPSCWTFALNRTLSFHSLPYKAASWSRIFFG